ncbi:PepSY domain-containing protein [Phenylobacterium sp. LjRoot219]
MSQARLIGALLLTTVAAGGLVVAGHGTPALAEQAELIRVAAPKQVTNTTLTQAIAAAEQASGGKVVEIRYRVDGTSPGFDAVAAKGGAFSHLRVAMPSNKVTPISQSAIPWRANWTLKADAKDLAKAKISLSDAVMQAEKMAGGPASAAGVAAPLTGDNAVLAYNVKLYRGNEQRRLVIDAVSGAPIENPTAFEDWAPDED